MDYSKIEEVHSFKCNSYNDFLQCQKYLLKVGFQWVRYGKKEIKLDTLKNKTKIFIIANGYYREMDWDYISYGNVIDFSKNLRNDKLKRINGL